MSFILRQITKRVGAPDIVREKSLAAAEPVIGRGSDCDIQLTDLAVSLRHAVSETDGAEPSQRGVAGSGKFRGQRQVRPPGRVSTWPTRRCWCSAAMSWRSRQGDDGNILVTATARENTAATDTADDQKHAFSLKYALFSQRQIAWITAAAILLACLIVPDRPVHHRPQSASDDLLGRGPAMVQRTAVARTSFPGKELRGLPPPGLRLGDRQRLPVLPPGRPEQDGAGPGRVPDPESGQPLPARSRRRPCAA